jgi:hypothetical protein
MTETHEKQRMTVNASLFTLAVVLASWTANFKATGAHATNSATGGKPETYMPAPQPVDTGRYQIGAILCPLWNRPQAWNPIVAYPDRKPLLGWYDEGNPEVTDWEVKWAVDHGVSFFMVCWYREKSNAGQQPVRSFLEHWLTEGLPGSRYGQQCKFALLWENTNEHASGVASEDDLLNNLLPYWIERYFRQPNYLRQDGKPVLGIHGPKRLVQELGGEKAAAVAVEKMRAACRKAGFPGLVLLGDYCWRTDKNPHPQMKQIGLDYSFAYHWPTFAGAEFMPAGLKPDPQQLIGGQERCWRSEAREALPNIVTVSMGWDSAPWGFACTRTQWRLTPAQFRTLCQRAKALLDDRPTDDLAGRVILIDNWNEYGEGHYVFPTQQYRFRYLDAIREVFAPHAPAHTDIVPEDIGRGPYDSRWRAAQNTKSVPSPRH